MADALSRAYQINPALNQRRANVRTHDEDVPKAAAGLMPSANILVNSSPQFSRIRQPTGADQFGNKGFVNNDFNGAPRGVTISLSQTLYDGGRTGNSIRQAESGVFAARATMQMVEQETLQNGATAYVNVLRDTAILALRKNHVSVLEEQLRQTRERFLVRDATQTDLSQSEVALSQSRSDFSAAAAMLKISIAGFHRVTGGEPKQLAPAQSVENLLPKSLNSAIRAASLQHPSIVAAMHQVDAAELAVKVAEGALAPTVSVSVQGSQQNDFYMGGRGSRQMAGQIEGSINIPIYQRGAEYASIRQAKEQLGEARLNADVQRDAVRESVAASFAQLNTARASIAFGEASVKSAESALYGVREEAKLGLRTTLDVLNAQQALLNTRINLVAAQHDRIVSSYAALGAIGRLSAAELHLRSAIYDPTAHFEQVRSKWFGLATPN